MTAPSGRGAAAGRRAERIRGRLDRVPGVRAAGDIQRRYVEARGSALAASITLYGFLALFAVAVLAIAALGFVSVNHADVAKTLTRNLGLTGEAARTVHQAVNTARRSRGAATVVGLVALAWTGTSLAIVLGDAYNATWHVDRRGAIDRALGAAWLAGAGVAIAAGGLATAAWSFLPGVFAPLVVVVSLATDAALLVWTSWLLPNRRVPIRVIVPAALVGSVAIEVLKLLGGYAVPHLVEHSSQLYGTIGVVFALLVWLLVFGRIIVYVAVLEARGDERRHGEREVHVEAPALPGR
jgi:membrane protein